MQKNLLLSFTVTRKHEVNGKFYMTDVTILNWSPCDRFVTEISVLLNRRKSSVYLFPYRGNAYIKSQNKKNLESQVNETIQGFCDRQLHKDESAKKLQMNWCLLL